MLTSVRVSCSRNDSLTRSSDPFCDIHRELGFGYREDLSALALERDRVAKGSIQPARFREDQNSPRSFAGNLAPPAVHLRHLVHLRMSSTDDSDDADKARRI